jgi:hypothetical protein
MKTKLFSLLFLVLSSSIFAQNLTPEQRVLELKKKKDLTIEDFDHENAGCPENSDCTKEMGLHRKKWQGLLRSLNKMKKESLEIVTSLEDFRRKNGIPVSFYTNVGAFKRFSPIIFESSCALHNPKKKENKILIGEAYIKDLHDKVAHIQIQDTSHDIPLGELVYLDPVYVYDPLHPEKNLIFFIPKGEKPIYINGDEITLLLEEEGVYYGLTIKTSGEWKITSTKTHKELGLEEFNQDVPCSKNDEANKYFGKEIYKLYYQDNFCQTIYDLKTKTQLQMRLPWSC